MKVYKALSVSVYLAYLILMGVLYLHERESITNDLLITQIILLAISTALIIRLMKMSRKRGG